MFALIVRSLPRNVFPSREQSLSGKVRAVSILAQLLPSHGCAALYVDNGHYVAQGVRYVENGLSRARRGMPSGGLSTCWLVRLPRPLPTGRRGSSEDDER